MEETKFEIWKEMLRVQKTFPGLTGIMEAMIESDLNAKQKKEFEEICDKAIKEAARCNSEKQLQ